MQTLFLELFDNNENKSNQVAFIMEKWAAWISKASNGLCPFERVGYGIDRADLIDQ